MAFFKLIKKYDKHLCKNRKMHFFEMIKKQKFYQYYISRKRNQKKTKLVIFDKDGTLINNEKIFAPWTEKLVTKISKNLNVSGKKLFDHLGYDNQQKIFTGDSIVARGTNDDIRNAITKFIKMESSSLTYEKTRELVEQNWFEMEYSAENILPFGNILKLFSDLQKSNIKVAICTSDDRYHTLKMVNHLNLSSKINHIICGDDIISSKPSPEPIWKICKNLDVLPSETIMIGDTISDIQAGINSRCKKVYGVLTGGYSSNHLQNADHIFNNITEAVEKIIYDSKEE